MLGAVLFTAGCAVKQNSGNTNGGQAPNQNGGFQNASGTPKMNFGAEINMSELAVGKMVTVFGTTNSDGTISATRIILGEMPMMDRGSASGTPKKFTKTTVNNSTTGGGSAPSGGEERFYGRFQGSERSNTENKTNNTEQVQQRARPSGESIVVGEILSMDQNSLTLKVKDGGSKIVYFTTDTKAYLAPTSTPRMGGMPPTSTEMMGPPSTTEN